MDNLAAFYRARYDEAVTHSVQGRERLALDICWELRLKPDIGVYRRAMVNLLIASLVDYEAIKYAEEALDLFDILRQDHGAVSPHIERMEQLAVNFINRKNQEASQANAPPKPPTDPISGLLSDPVEPSVEARSDDKSEQSEQQDTPKKVLISYDSNPPRTDPYASREEPPKTINNTVKIEGFLRDPAYHKPRGPVPSTAVTTQNGAALSKNDNSHSKDDKIA